MEEFEEEMEHYMDVSCLPGRIITMDCIEVKCNLTIDYMSFSTPWLSEMHRS